MKKTAFSFTGNAACLFILFVTLFYLMAGQMTAVKAAGVLSFSAETAPSVSAETVCLLDLETGQILYEKNLHQKRPPASLTKVLTTIIAIEEGKLKDIVRISPRAVYQEGSS